VSVRSCENCGREASTLAQCPGCGAVVGNIDHSVLPTGVKRGIFPILLGIFGLCLMIPAADKGMSAYRVRIAENQATRDSLQRVTSERQRDEERRIMIVRADSVLKAVPRSQIGKVDTDRLNSDVLIVGSRSDSAAQRWIKSAKAELKRRSARKGRLRTNDAGH